MHVLIIPSWYPLHPGDIGGSFFREQAIALHRHGCKVGVIYPQFRSLRNFKSAFVGKRGVEVTNDEGVITYRSHATRWIPRLQTPYRNLWLRAGLRLYKEYVVQNGRPDVIHAHSILNGGLLASKINEVYGTPFVITEHSTAFARGLLSEKQLKLASNASRNAARKFAVSPEFSTLLNEVLPQDNNSWHIMPNIVNQKFLDFPIKKTKNKKIFKFINIAFMSDKKRQNNIISAFAEKFKENTNVLLTIGGSGPERTSLVELASYHGIAERVFFPGALSRIQVIEEIAAADTFVLSSQYETFGVVVIEALALGKPVIATRCGGPESIVREQDGLLVPVDDVSSLATAMLHIYENNNLYDPIEIRSACRERYSERSVTDKLIQEYRYVVSNY